MKTIKKTLLTLGMFALSLTGMQAQDKEMTNMFKVGGNVGIAAPSTNASANVGVDFAYQHIVTPGFGLGIATGYNHFFGKENKGYENNDFGVVPLAAMVRIYPQQTGFYFGTDIGYGFITGDDRVASNALTERPDGGLYIKPEIGWHNKHWNFALQYKKVFTGSNGNMVGQDYNVSSIGVGISYNLPLGASK